AVDQEQQQADYGEERYDDEEGKAELAECTGRVGPVV
ncbi:MAG: hypothetical protein QOE89_376, partial [Pseudonocardiales bacterium]|nr:hypothetical protein [Pseudonocardiales bacterium]